jgi:hypothetical protein
MLLLAQAEQVIKAADKAIESSGQYGLIGVILVLVLLFLGTCVIVAFKFSAPLLKDVAQSAVSCSQSIQTQMAAQSTQMAVQSAIMSSHGEKLEEIRGIIQHHSQEDGIRNQHKFV